jgi:hypothetical protein
MEGLEEDDVVPAGPIARDRAGGVAGDHAVAVQGQMGRAGARMGKAADAKRLIAINAF